jgi:NADH-quinone oxidoreductase subunit M
MSIDFLRALLLCLLIVPAVAAAVVAALGPRRLDAIRWVSLGSTLLSLLFTAILVVHYVGLTRQREETKAAAAEEADALPTFHPEFVVRSDLLRLGAEQEDRTIAPIQFYLGLDGLNVWLVALTAVLMVSSVLVSWNAIQERPNEYYAWLLALGTGLVGVFLAFDILLFYVFFELTLVPLFFLIGIWGGPERRHAARKFFIYTLTGSLITFLGLLGVVLACYSKTNELTFAIPELVTRMNGLLKTQTTPFQGYWSSVQFWVFLAMIAGFAIKVPLFPLHTWLPLAHVEAPTAGSVLLAGVLLKLGTYGFLRLALPLAPDAALSLGVPLIGTLAVIGIIYGAVCSLAQDDMKKLVAYSSVSHLGFCMLGMFALNAAGLTGSLLQMINHGLSTGALFLLVGMLYERYHTRQMAAYGGMAARLKLLACFMVFISLSSLGLPGLNGFVGEALVFLGMFDHAPKLIQVGSGADGLRTLSYGPPLAVLGAAGIVLGAWYLLNLLLRIFFGPEKEPEHEGHHPIKDLNGRELCALVPIAVLCLVLGLYPQPVLDTARRDLDVVAKIAADAQKRADDATRQEAASLPTQPLAAGQAGEEKAP